MNFQMKKGKFGRFGWEKVRQLQEKGDLTEEKYERATSPV